jgi:FtsP/CotA-like multicopper oxidase with cupredoxin domain
MTPSEFHMNRRSFLTKSGTAAAIGLGDTWPNFLRAQAPERSIDHTIRIGPISLELAPGKIVKTTGYNGTVPGPVLRLREGKPVVINVINNAGYPDLIHWHGLYLPSIQDGSMEEGSPIIAPGQSLVYSFTPKPAGTRWYHSHAMAGTDLTRSTYSGEYGFLIVEPAAGDPGRYDREVLLAAHLWEGEWVSMQDIRKGPPPDNGLEVMYHGATLGDRMLGHGEPIRVKRGERVLFRLLNASASMGITLALPGHRFNVLALDGNPVPTQTAVDLLWLDVAERADVSVEMNNPGVWVLGSADDMDRQMGLEKIPGGRGGYNRWTINGKSWPDTNPLFTVQQGKRYRLVMDNHSGDQHPVHTHRHTFEVTKIGDKPTSGLMKDTLSMPRFSTAEVDFVADDPGPTFFHCHHQDHMDEGFAGLITYS